MRDDAGAALVRPWRIAVLIALAAGLSPWLAVPVPVAGANLKPVSVVGGPAGPIAFMERDAAVPGAREVVVHQTCVP